MRIATEVSASWERRDSNASAQQHPIEEYLPQALRSTYLCWRGRPRKSKGVTPLVGMVAKRGRSIYRPPPLAARGRFPSFQPVARARESPRADGLQVVAIVVVGAGRQEKRMSAGCDVVVRKQTVIHLVFSARLNLTA